MVKNQKRPKERGEPKGKRGKIGKKTRLWLGNCHKPITTGKCAKTPFFNGYINTEFDQKRREAQFLPKIPLAFSQRAKRGEGTTERAKPGAYTKDAPVSEKEKRNIGRRQGNTVVRETKKGGSSPRNNVGV